MVWYLISISLFLMLHIPFFVFDPDFDFDFAFTFDTILYYTILYYTILGHSEKLTHQPKILSHPIRSYYLLAGAAGAAGGRWAHIRHPTLLAKSVVPYD